ncbi:diguanylate cyclase [Salinarimonas ramus]|uniref:Diguanylate cyclase n=2 Tax=Salinarimonas ramus TaxID=690164 RepID=A0A917QIG9_9HYPH|nr:diguanylate cyclase [Salinarimonas ramus]
MTVLSQLSPDPKSVCEAEPITRPGAVQPFGFLVAVEGEEKRVAFASANVVAFLGRAASDLVGRPLSEVLCEASCARIDSLMDTERYAPTNFTRVRVRDDAATFDAVAHRSGRHLVVECLAPAEPADAAQAISDAQRLIQRLREAPDLDTMLARAADEARALTGFDRAMVYRFDEDDHGAVVAESRRADLEPYLGLHYPASDIPSQARRMYLLQRVRHIPDIDAVPAALVGAPGHDPADLDLTHSVVRAVSPYHVAYLRNMGVKATLAVSLIVDDALWGMLVFHHGRRRDVDCTMRGLCDVVGQALSALVDVRTGADREAVVASRTAAIRAVERELAEADAIGTGLGTVADRLNEAMGAGGCYIRIGGASLRFGTTPPEPACRTILARLAEEGAGYCASAELRTRDRALAAHAESAAGAAAIFLPGRPGDGVVWFRPERRRTISWGGDPNRPVHIDPRTGELGPRRSFATFLEEVDGTSTRFDAADAEVALRLRRAVIAALLRISEERLNWARNFDALTGLLRREVAEARLRRMVAAAESQLVGAVVVGVARFTALVERFGAKAGEEALVETARRLQELVRKGEVVARYGEESFLLIVRRDGPDDLRRLGTAILDAFRTPLASGDREIPLTVHAGIAAHPGCALDVLVTTAVLAEREAAKERRGRWVLLERPPTREAPSAAELELEIAPALARGEFRCAFAPILALDDGRPLGVEALPRWTSRAYGEVPADLFLPAAVEAGQIFALTVAHLENAMRTVRPEIAAGRIGHLAIAVEPALLERRSFAAAILSALDRNRIAPDALVVGVPEAALDVPAIGVVLGELRARGVRVAVTHFGAGRSALASLAGLPVDCARIDRSLLAAALADARGAALFSAVVGLVRALGCDTLVEGITTEEERARARAEGCRAAQGPLLAPELEADALASWLDGQAGVGA